MASVFSEDLKVQNAENFKDLLTRQTSNTRLYFTFGKATSWANDSAPPQANTSVTALNEVWSNMIGAKLLTGNEVRHAIPRKNWANNTVYAAYDHCICSLILFNPDVTFYIMTPDWNVYKCLANNNGASSTVMPTQNYTDKAIEETDGYIWKYMYTVPVAERTRFSTSEYIPVRTLKESDGSLQWQVQQSATSGGIEAIKMTSFGTGYANANSITITITGDGSGAKASARINSTNHLTNIVITNKGLGYTYANVIITDANTTPGTGANARAMISPTGGHGSDPMRELGGSYLILNPRLETSENGKFPVTNDYRQVSIIASPKLAARPNVIASNVVYSQYTSIIFDYSTSSYQQDEIVYQGTSLEAATFKGTVLNWDTAGNTMYVINTTGTVSVGDIMVGSNSAAEKFVQSVKTNELAPYTGQLLYIDNMEPITRAADQIEDFKIVMKF